MANPCIVITTGGTGGHIFPALTIAKKIQEVFPQFEILFIGGQGMEATLCKKYAVPFTSLKVQGFIGKKGKVKSLFSFAKATLVARKILKEKNVQLVIGFGGYASVCPLIAAKLLRRPFYIHEQNSVPGASNRLLAKFAQKIFLSFAESENYFPKKKCILTGNPVREAFFQIEAKEPAKNLLVVGGSLGAAALNEVVINLLPEFEKNNISLWHQVGEKQYEWAKKEYEKKAYSTDLLMPFIDDMPKAFAFADIILCRAGASTIFEVAAAKRCAIFVPFPHASHNHQYHNAKALVSENAGFIIEQNKLTPKMLLDELLRLFNNPEKLAETGKNARKFSNPNTAELIVSELKKNL